MDKRRNHIIFWVGYSLWFGLIIFIQNKDLLPLHLIGLEIFLNCVETLIFFYFFAYVLLPNTLPSKKYYFFILGLLSSVIVGVLLKYFTLIVLNKFSFTQFNSEVLNPILIKTIRRAFRAINLAFPLWFLKILIFESKQKEDIIMKSYTLRKTELNANLLGLKNQINPHFFYNILNFIYAQSLPYSSKLSSSILNLSDLMRYAIRENDEEGKVSLEQEVDYVKNYIQLEGLHSTDKYDVVLESNGNLMYRRVFPMTFQPFLENSYRYGENNKFYLKIKENQVQFLCTYLKKNHTDVKEIYDHFENLKKKIKNEYVQDVSIVINSDTNYCKLQLLLNV
jgi:two-component system, LytTR family, sensor kinase